ncbi:RluA family pseudouridine synthase [Hyphococcus luteus]|uniref:RNA pseudouridine synthase n=1 Tax=Hyphococcus luteus TaxID=2058213 RepID=A0A2S7K6E2_9PROT|nr:RNA pseudouridine synthase [Marinicaulis flavus]PQA88084.1 RNA pseudouridine synthase [Marinicaulis flavus]
MAYPPDFLLDRLLYRDGLMLVIDKPAGLPVHGGPGGGENLENYFDALRFGLPRLPALAHRLDRDTSGCLVLGRHPKALRKLGKLFSEGQVEKTYWAVTKGVPEKLSGTIDAPLKKETRGSGWRVVIAEDGQSAVTTYRTLKQKDGFAFIEAKPKTGRTHQIRVHLASIGAPILGDPQYGELSPEERAGPMMLHARRLVVPISKNKEPVTVEAPPPDAMAEKLKELGVDV